jgi:hypothetical protein
VESLDDYVQLLDAVENVERLQPGLMSMQDMRAVLTENLDHWRKEAKETERTAGSKGGKKAGRGRQLDRGRDSGPTPIQNDANRTRAKVAAATGLSEKDAAYLTELHERALGKRRNTDPIGWEPDYHLMQIAQGLISRVEDSDITYRQAARDLREWVRDTQQRWRTNRTAAPVVEPPPVPPSVPPVIPEPVLAAVAPVVTPDPPPEPVAPPPSPVVLNRPLGTGAAAVLLEKCPFGEVLAFVSAIRTAVTDDQRQTLMRLFCGDQ